MQFVRKGMLYEKGVSHLIQEAWIWIIIVIAAAVAFPVIAHQIRKKDFENQVSGKKAEREWKGKISYDRPEQANSYYEELKEEAVRKTKDNIAGI